MEEIEGLEGKEKAGAILKKQIKIWYRRRSFYGYFPLKLIEPTAKG